MLGAIAPALLAQAKALALRDSKGKPLTLKLAQHTAYQLFDTPRAVQLMGLDTKSPVALGELIVLSGFNKKIKKNIKLKEYLSYSYEPYLVS